MEPHVYHMKRFCQVLYCAGGLACIGFSVFIGRRDPTASFLAILLFVILGIFVCCIALRSRLTLSDTEISVRCVFDERSAKLSDIEGWREGLDASNSTYWIFQLRDSGKLCVNQHFAVDDAFLDFLSSVRNLDQWETRIVP